MRHLSLMTKVEGSVSWRTTISGGPLRKIILMNILLLLMMYCNGQISFRFSAIVEYYDSVNDLQCFDQIRYLRSRIVLWGHN